MTRRTLDTLSCSCHQVFRHCDEAASICLCVMTLAFVRVMLASLLLLLQLHLCKLPMASIVCLSGVSRLVSISSGPASSWRYMLATIESQRKQVAALVSWTPNSTQAPTRQWLLGHASQDCLRQCKMHERGGPRMFTLLYGVALLYALGSDLRKLNVALLVCLSGVPRLVSISPGLASYWRYMLAMMESQCKQVVALVSWTPPNSTQAPT
eukprot:2473153-Amphidinium_carterae.1